MHLISVNLGKEQPIQNNKLGMSGIFKHSVQGDVTITPLGLVDDAVIDTKHHGGPDQAVYAYFGPDYAWWSSELGYELEPGTFGDNLTISDLESAELFIGDQIHVGAVTIEVTSPRIPCSTLAARMGDPMFVKRFRAAERPGVYCRVIKPGVVRAGDPVTYEKYNGPTLTVREHYRLYYEKDITEADLRRLLAAPIAIRARQENEAHLADLLAKANAPK